MGTRRARPGRIARSVALILGGGLAAFGASVVLRQSRTFDAPLPAIVASSDPDVIARGRYLVTGPGHCVSCHGDEASSSVDRALSGGRGFDLPIGRVHAPNLTSDRATGLGSVSDGAIARALRHGVGFDGRALVGLMAFGDLADDDLRAIVSYLRTQPAIRHPTPPNEWTALGRVVRAFVLKPEPPSRVARGPAPSGPTVENGEYLANAVANCRGCHTERNVRTGRPSGPPFAGGMEFEIAPGRRLSSPNLTPDAATGRIAAWTEDEFVARFRAGPVIAESPMPWLSFAAMRDEDLRAIHRYLRSLPAVRRGPAIDAPWRDARLRSAYGRPARSASPGRSS